MQEEMQWRNSSLVRPARATRTERSATAEGGRQERQEESIEETEGSR